MFAIKGGLTRQHGPAKNLPYVKRNPNWKGGGVPRGGTEHAGHAYWTSSMNPDGVPQKMPKIEERTYSKVVTIHDVHNPSRKRAPAGAFSRSPNISAMGIVPPATSSGGGPSQNAGLGNSNGRPETATKTATQDDDQFFDAPQVKTESPFFSDDNPFQSGPLFGSPLEFSVGTPSVDSSTSSIFPGSFPSSETGINGGGPTSLGSDGLQDGSEQFSPSSPGN